MIKKKPRPPAPSQKKVVKDNQKIIFFRPRNHKKAFKWMRLLAVIAFIQWSTDEPLRFQDLKYY